MPIRWCLAQTCEGNVKTPSLPRIRKPLKPDRPLRRADSPTRFARLQNLLSECRTSSSIDFVPRPTQTEVAERREATKRRPQASCGFAIPVDEQASPSAAPGAPGSAPADPGRGVGWPMRLLPAVRQGLSPARVARTAARCPGGEAARGRRRTLAPHSSPASPERFVSLRDPDRAGRWPGHPANRKTVLGHHPVTRTCCFAASMIRSMTATGIR